MLFAPAQGSLGCFRSVDLPFVSDPFLPERHMVGYRLVWSGKLIQAKDERFWQWHVRAFTSTWLQKVCVLPLFFLSISVHTNICSFLPKPPMWCFRGPLETHRACILATLTGSKHNLSYSGVYIYYYCCFTKLIFPLPTV